MASSAPHRWTAGGAAALGGPDHVGDGDRDRDPSRALKEKQQQLAGVVKGVHAKLRKKYKQCKGSLQLNMDTAFGCIFVFNL